MSFRLYVLLALSLCAGAAENPLSSPALGPAPGIKYIVASTATPDGFLTIRAEGPEFVERLVATRISLDGQVADPHGVVIASLARTYSARTFDLRADGDRYLLTMITPRRAAVGNVYDYEQRRITLDSEGRVVAEETAVLPNSPPRSWPANHYGETLSVGPWPQYPTLTILFVGRNGTPRNPTPLPQLTGILSIVPYEDEWLILGTDSNRRLRWCRLKESARDKPLWRVIEPFTGSYNQTVVHADGHFGVLVARTSLTAPHYRNLTLYVITPEGAIRPYSLLTNERVQPLAPYERTPAGTVAKEGDSWIVAYRWADFDQREEMRVWRVGKKIESSVIEAGAVQTWPALLSGPTHNLLLVRQSRPELPYGWDDLYGYVFARGTFVPPSTPPALLSWSPPLQTSPTAVGGAHGVLGAWIENDGRLMVRLLGADATTPIAVSSSAWDAQAPAVARNGDTFIVGWQEWSRIPYSKEQRVLIARFDGHGNPIDAEPLVLQRLPDAANTVGMSVAAEGDGFRLAWIGRVLPDAFGRDADQVVFTTHVGARANEFANPEPLRPSGGDSSPSQPFVVSNGNDAIVLWAQADEVAAKSYTGGVEERNFASLLGLEAIPVAAAANGNELLLAWVRSSADGKTHCTWAQRLSFTGVKLAPAEQLECTAAFPAHTSVVWDRNRWRVTSTQSPSYVHELRADGTVAGLAEIFPPNASPRLVHLFANDDATAAVYVRSDAQTEFVDRAFLRTFPRPRARSVRP